MKIIKEKNRIIIIEKELRDPKYWTELLESLTFAEGMALLTAFNSWNKLESPQTHKCTKDKELNELDKRITDIEDELSTLGTHIIV